MGMTRRDFVMLSDAIREQLQYDNDLNAFVWRIAERIGEYNPSFNKAIFLKACGVLK